MNITVNFFSTKYMKHCAGCPSLPAHMKTKIGPLDELPCYSINGLSENEDDNIDDVEFDDNNNTSASGSVPDVSDDLDSPDSPKNQIHGEKISEAFDEWIKESEARESGNSFSSQEQRLPVSSTTPLTMKSSSTITTPLQRIEIIEEADFMNVINRSGSGLSQPAQSGGTLEANTNRTAGSTAVVPHEAEIIDLSTPSPSCGIVNRKKRRVPSFVTDFIDLTNSPNFVQL